MIDCITTSLLWSHGMVIVYGVALLALLGVIFWRPLVPFALGLLVFCIYFFRNPERSCAAAFHDESVLVCPADGRVVAVESGVSDPSMPGYTQKVAIFLSIFDVHVTRVPMAGEIEAISYRPGAFLMAFAPKSSDVNERNEVVIYDKERDRSVAVRQIAGFIARRICCWVDNGQSVTTGQTLGMIRFGSRVEVFLPEQVSVAVGKGDYVYGGHTVLGYWR